MFPEALFGVVEEKPNSGIEIAEKYCNSSFEQKTTLITQLKAQYQALISDLQRIGADKLKADRDISGTKDKGPLNPWYRLLCGQTAAHFYQTITG